MAAIDSRVLLTIFGDPLEILGLVPSRIVLSADTDPDTVVDRSFQTSMVTMSTRVQGHCITYTRLCRVKVFVKITRDGENAALRRLLDIEDSIVNAVYGLTTVDVTSVNASYELAGNGRLLILNVDVGVEHTRAR